MFGINVGAAPMLALLSGLSVGLPVGSGRAAAVVTKQDTVVSSGQFGRIDRSHWARGTATVYHTSAGDLVLQFADAFESARGPDLRVVLSSHANPRRGRDLGEFIELDRLKQASGAQSYAIPADVDVGAVRTVVIYCKRFDVIFSTARMAPPSDRREDVRDRPEDRRTP